MERTFTQLDLIINQRGIKVNKDGVGDEIGEFLKSEAMNQYIVTLDYHDVQSKTMWPSESQSQSIFFFFCKLYLYSRCINLAHNNFHQFFAPCIGNKNV